MKIWSDSFSEGGSLPFRHSKDDSGISPSVRWSDIPAGTRELALVVEHASVGTGERRFAYWTVYAIPPDWTQLAEGFGNHREPGAAAPAKQGVNGLGHLGYDGPYGSIGREILLRFRLFALSQSLGLPEGESLANLLQATKGRVLAEAAIEANYMRTLGGRRRAG